MATTTLSPSRREAVLRRDAYRCRVCDDPTGQVSPEFKVTMCQPCLDIVAELGGPLVLFDQSLARASKLTEYSYKADTAPPALADDMRLTIVRMRQARLTPADLRVYPATCAGCRQKFRPNRRGSSNFLCPACTVKHFGAEFRADAPGYICATVAQQLAQPAKTITGITGCLQARQNLGLDPKSMVRLLGEYHPNGRAGKPYSRSHLWRVEQGERLASDEMLLAYAGLLNAVIGMRTRGRVQARVAFGARPREKRAGTGRWRVTLWAFCPGCGGEFKVSKLEAQRCPRCRG